MREQARDKGRLQDIIDYSNNVIELIEGVSCDDLATDNLVHGYAQVAYQILWSTATESIPALLQQALEYMEYTDWEQWEQTTEG